MVLMLPAMGMKLLINHSATPTMISADNDVYQRHFSTLLKTPGAIHCPRAREAQLNQPASLNQAEYHYYQRNQQQDVNQPPAV